MAFHITSMDSCSGKILNNSFFIKNRIKGSLFTDQTGKLLNYYSILIPFTESPGGIGCFSTQKTGYTPKSLNICSTVFLCFTDIFYFLHLATLRVQRNTISTSTRARLPVFHNLFITNFHLFLPSFPKTDYNIYVYHSENKR